MKLFLELVQFFHRIPKRKCRRCARYRGYCPLQDLDPCCFVRKPITADLINGAEIRQLTTWNGNLQDCICIPINNYCGTVQNGSKGKDGEPRQFKHVYINLEAIEIPSKGVHIIKPAVSAEMMQHLTEEQMRRRPIVGEMTQWGMKRNTNNGQNHE